MEKKICGHLFYLSLSSPPKQRLLLEVFSEEGRGTDFVLFKQPDTVFDKKHKHMRSTSRP
jgi:hypothetical protein